MGLFLGENENKIKGFLEDQKHEVHVLSQPRWVQQNAELDKELFND